MAVVTTWLPAPTGGAAPSLPPDQLKDNVARRLRNFLVHHPGRIVPRGSIGGSATPLVGSAAHSTGAPMGATFHYGDTVIVHHKNPTATPTVDTWRVPINAPTTAAELTQPLQGAEAGRSVNMSTGVITNLNIDVFDGYLNSISGWRYARLGGIVYTNTYGGESVAIPGGVAQKSLLLKNQDLGVKLTEGPIFVQDVFSHLERIWVAAARDPGGSNYEPNSLYYTNPGGTTEVLNQTSDWQDPVTGELNKISVGDPSDGDFLVALGRASGHLVIFMRHSIWIAYGTAPSNLVLRQLRTLHGCVDARSVAVCDDGVYFASQRGYERFDGTAFELLSAPVADTWLEFSSRGPAASTVNHSYITATALYNDYLFISIGTQPHAASQPDGAERNWLFHMPTRSWIDLSSNIATMGLPASGAFNRATRTTKYLALWGASKWARCEDLTFGLNASGLVDADASASYNVTLGWTTRLVNLAGRWASAVLHALTIDAHQHYVATTPSPGPWATIAAEDSGGTSLLPTTNVEGYPSPGTLRARPFFSRNAETNRGDVTVTVASSTGATEATRIAKLDVYGLGIAATPGRERHTS